MAVLSIFHRRLRKCIFMVLVLHISLLVDSLQGDSLDAKGNNADTRAVAGEFAVFGSGDIGLDMRMVYLVVGQNN